MEPLAVLPLGPAINQPVPPLVVLVVTVKFKFSVALVLVTVICCGAGVAPFTGTVKLSALGFAATRGVLLMCMVTGMATGLFGVLAPFAFTPLTRIVPLQRFVPAGTTAAFGVTVNDPCVEPDVAPPRANHPVGQLPKVVLVL